MILFVISFCRSAMAPFSPLIVIPNSYTNKYTHSNHYDFDDNNLENVFHVNLLFKFTIYLLFIHNFVGRKARKTGQFSTGFKSYLNKNEWKRIWNFDFLTLLMVVKVLLVWITSSFSSNCSNLGSLCQYIKAFGLA